MHYSKQLVTILLLGFFTLNSCKKEEGTILPTPGSNKANEINTKIDGQAWSGSVLSWAISGGTRQINGTSSSSSIQIFMPVDTVGNFDASSNIITVSYNDGTTTWSNNVSGYVNITSNTDDHVEGDFEMVISSYFNSDTLNFTAGTFYFKS